MKLPRRPVFLARSPYRRRRLRDAARLLPVLGAVLLILPALWSPPGQGLRRMSSDVGYFFLSWLALIAIAAAFSRGLARPGDPGEDED